MERVRYVLAPFVANRLRGTLRERVESAWLALGGPACAFTHWRPRRRRHLLRPARQARARRRAARCGACSRKQLETLYAAPDTGEDARVQIMTIHKAKGLEFDTVIVPGLDRVPRVSDRPLFAWKARADGTPDDGAHPARARGRRARLRLPARAGEGRERSTSSSACCTSPRRAPRSACTSWAMRGSSAKNGGEPTVRRAPSTTLLGKAWTRRRSRTSSGAIPRFLDRIGRGAQARRRSAPSCARSISRSSP